MLDVGVVRLFVTPVLALVRWYLAHEVGLGYARLIYQLSNSNPGERRALKGRLNMEHKQELSHAEVWDDSSLINAWDTALQEYKVKKQRFLSNFT